MKWTSAVSRATDIKAALQDVVTAVRNESKESEAPDVGFFFISPHLAPHYEKAHIPLLETLGMHMLIGCSGGGVIGNGQEIESRPGLSLTCGWLPDVRLQAFHLENDSIPDLDAGPRAWHQALQISPDVLPQFVLIGDPFSFNTSNFIEGLDFAFPKSIKVGGLASAARAPGGNALYLNHRIFRSGLVGVALSGHILVDAVVAQGCRPIGDPMTITQCQENVLLALDGEPPMEILEEIYHSLTHADQELFRTSLFLGLLRSAGQEPHQPGDFLIRNIIGADPDKGHLAVSEELRPGQTVQFHLRDAETSATDLQNVLDRHKMRKSHSGGAGALLFSCLGRGQYLYGRPNHDSELFQKRVGNVPLGGFFCNGEIGPVGNETYLHGYTSCFGIFRSPPASKSKSPKATHTQKKK